MPKDEPLQDEAKEIITDILKEVVIDYKNRYRDTTDEYAKRDKRQTFVIALMACILAIMSGFYIIHFSNYVKSTEIDNIVIKRKVDPNTVDNSVINDVKSYDKSNINASMNNIHINADK